jgi:preprotein translocase subunit SecA
MMKKLGWEQGEAIEHPWVSRAIENAQRKVEARNFDIRKNLLEYDDVANDQRKVIYEQRAELMSTEDISDTVKAIREDVVDDTISQYIPPQSVAEMWDVASLETRLKSDYLLDLPIQKWLDDDDELFEDTLREKIHSKVVEAYNEKEEAVGGAVMRHFEKSIMLQHLDSMWKEHLGAMDHLRQGIHLRGYAQKNPKQEYKREAFELFTQMLDEIKSEVVSILAKVQVKEQSDVEAVDEQRRQQSESQAMNFQHDKASAMGQDSSDEAEAQEPEEEHVPFVREDRKVGRNEPCPCGSGRKFKQCHGKLT